jgi:RNA exonuclease 4
MALARISLGALAMGFVALGFALETHAFTIHVLAAGIFIVCLFPAASQQLKHLYFRLIKKRRSRIPDYVRKAEYVAIDCEMVGIGPNGKQSALARVSIVDWDLKVIFDTYVQVMDRVTDYRTHVSGIRKKHLKGPNAMNCRKCREFVAELLQDKVVVGHGLENDFDALNLIHPDAQIRDTSLYQPLQRFDSGRWRPKKLRELVQHYLGADDFQKGEHDSIHDAKAVMELYHLFYHKWEQSLEN